jgi:hypothetical protein
MAQAFHGFPACVISLKATQQTKLDRLWPYTDIFFGGIYHLGFSFTPLKNIIYFQQRINKPPSKYL